MEAKLAGFVFDVDGQEYVNMIEVREPSRKFMERLLKEYETDRDVESFPLVRESDEMETAVYKLYSDPESVMDNLNTETLERVYVAARNELKKRQMINSLNEKLNDIIAEAKANGISLNHDEETIGEYDIYFA